MTRFAIVFAILLAAALPLWGQDPLKQELDKLKAELAAKTARVEELQRLIGKQEADQEVFVRQVEVQLAQIQELTLKIEDYRVQLARALNDRKLLEAELAFTKKPPEKAGPRVSLDAKVTAVANEIGLVVLSVGKDDGVREGDEFIVSRSGDFVTKAVIDRVDRKWSAGKVVQKKSDPRVGDDASSRVSAPESPETIRGIRKELDDVRRQVRELSDRLLPAWKEHGLALEEASEDLRAHLGIARGLLVRGVRESSPAEKAGLKAMDVVVDLTEPQLLDAIAQRQAIRVMRQGRPRTLGEK